MQAALPAGFQVREGSIFGPRVDPAALLITGLHFTQDAYAELGPTYRHEEHYNIQCVLCASQGVDDQASLLGTTYGFYSAISVAVANHPDLNSTCRLGWCRQLDYAMGYDGKGFAVATLTFEVQVQARVTSLT
jgi:hypothetical protein